jgi:hypothetical protein
MDRNNEVLQCASLIAVLILIAVCSASQIISCIIVFIPWMTNFKYLSNYLIIQICLNIIEQDSLATYINPINNIAIDIWCPSFSTNPRSLRRH